jgi:hypothetical protein
MRGSNGRGIHAAGRERDRKGDDSQYSYSNKFDIKERHGANVVNEAGVALRSTSTRYERLFEKVS